MSLAVLSCDYEQRQALVSHPSTALLVTTSPPKCQGHMCASWSKLAPSGPFQLLHCLHRHSRTYPTWRRRVGTLHLYLGPRVAKGTDGECQDVCAGQETSDCTWAAARQSLFPALSAGIEGAQQNRQGYASSEQVPADFCSTSECI